MIDPKHGAAMGGWTAFFAHLGWRGKEVSEITLEDVVATDGC